MSPVAASTGPFNRRLERHTVARMAEAQALAPLRSRLARAALRWMGWRVVFEPPPGPRAVVVVYPHTSNWDFVIGVVGRAAVDLPLRFIGKDTLFRFPLGPVMRWLGGAPVDRSAPHGLVGELRGEFERSPRMFLAITPEGTRSRRDHWKSGFYHLARGLDLPVGLGLIDYGAREIGIGRWLRLTGDPRRDMDEVRAFYAGRHGKRRENESDVRLRNEAGGAREEAARSPP